MFHIENLDALPRDKSRLGRLRDGGAKIVARTAATLKRRLVPFAKRAIGKDYNLPAREIGKRLRARGDQSSVTLTGLGAPLTLIKYGAQQNASGVAVQIRRGQSLKIAHAFIRVPTGASGAVPQVLIRQAVAPQLPDGVEELFVVDHSKHGYPIALLGGPSIADMLREDMRSERIDDFAQQVFGAEVDRLLEMANG